MAKEVIYESIENFGLNERSKSRKLFSKIGIIGCGIVGQHIARMASYYGVEVVFIDVSENKIEDAYSHISDELDKEIERWGLTISDKKSLLSRIQGSLGYEDLKGCDFVIEAIRAVDRGGKICERREIFNRIEKVVSKECIIATNSTTIAITELASELKYKERSIGVHFFTSSSKAKAIDVIKGLYTSDETYDKVCHFVNMMGRTVLPVAESAGLVSIRLFAVLLNEACEIMMEGVSSLQHIDKTLNLGYGMRHGVFEIADRIGIDKVIRWMENLYSEFGDMKYKPSALIKKLYRNRMLGISTRVGFYTYDEKGKLTEPNPKLYK
ncbi:MAG: 3-hydroxyacyl-CoA dehydrogenase family protein [Bacteroidales bacterium]